MRHLPNDKAVVMAANHPHHMAVMCDHRCEPIRIAQTDVVEEQIVRAKRRVVEGDNCRLALVLAQCPVKPTRVLVTKLTMCLARYDLIDGDDTNGKIIDCE